MITLIAAVSEYDGKLVIGKDGDLPWRRKKGSRLDMEHFKDLTAGIDNEPGHPVIMGRSTWESIPAKFRPLTDRVNYVLSRNPDFEIELPGVQVCRSLEEARNYIDAKQPSMENIDYGHAFIIGGAALYEEGLKIADRLELTFFDKSYAGDTFFPQFSSEEWMNVAGQKKPHLWFKTYERKK